MTFLSSGVVCARKAPKSICQQASPGSFDSAPRVLCHAIHLRGAPLRMTILWEFKETHSNQFALWVSKNVPQPLKPSSAQAIYSTAEPAPFVGQSLPQPLRVSQGFRCRQNWYLKNLIWRSLAELSPGLRPISANLSRAFFFKLPQNRHPERSDSQIDRVTQRL